MIKKIYIDNFKCLVNFNLELSPISLFLGLNGSGKSSVFEAIYRLRQLITGEKKVGQLFPQTDKTRWQDVRFQRFIIEMEGNGGHYKYELIIDHHNDRPLQRISKESLFYNTNPLYSFENGTAHLFRDDFSAGPQFLADWGQSGLVSILERPENKKLSWFKNRISNIIIVGMTPGQMTASSSSEEEIPSANFSNFSSWYRYVSQEYQENLADLMNELKNVIQGFDSLRIPTSGENAKTLQALFHFEGHQSATPFSFDELSDGQRAIIGLYSLLFCLKNHEYTLFIDEPDNYLALAEIQPWIDALIDKCDAGEIVQSVLISHHPEMIDHIGVSSGIMFEQDVNAHILTRKASEVSNETGLQLSEIIARGWDE